MGDTIARESLIFELKEVQSYLRGIGEYRKANMIDFALGYVESPAREQLNILKNAINDALHSLKKNPNLVANILLRSALDQINGKGEDK